MTDTEAYELQHTSRFTLSSKIRYLGTHLTKQGNSLIQDNYLKIIKQIKNYLKVWGKLSLLGRIGTIKMNVLPKILFLFQNFPILFSFNLINDLDKVNLINDLNKVIRNFIWHKKARIKVKYLQDKKEWRFALPNLLIYYKASSLVWIKDCGGFCCCCF